MSVRKRHVEVLKCDGDDGVRQSEREVSDVNILSSTSVDNSSNLGEPQNTLSSTPLQSGNPCDNEPFKTHGKMKKHFPSKKSSTSSWSTGHLASALRLGLGVFVIITFLLSLTQIQNVEGQRNFDAQNDPETQKKIPNEQIRNWAISFGNTLWETARIATRFDALKQKFVEKGAVTKKVDGFRMVQTMAASIEAMMQHKIDAIKRIMENAEEASLGHKYEKSLGERLKMKIEDNGYHYFNAKKINILDEDAKDGESYWDRALSAIDREPNDQRNQVGYTRIKLESNKHFSGIPVNANYSTVHVPTNVYDGDPKVVNAIKWSKMLDDIFKDNYKRDPSLSWQYFGSSTGFMRQYPAMKWRTDEHDPDLYDARMRDWYIKSAASPKEIVILLDTSGSMTGLRKEIAKHVVLNILETLSEDDFVTIYSFSKTPRPLVKCFSKEDEDGNERAELVQATPENIQKFQEATFAAPVHGHVNFTNALVEAFAVLRDNRMACKQESKECELSDSCSCRGEKERFDNINFKDDDPDPLHKTWAKHLYGSKCVKEEPNQAIIMVTDGVPDSDEFGVPDSVFKEHNRETRVSPNGQEVTYMPARLFMYVIGRDIKEVGDTVPSMHMACLNKGYFTHVTTLAEVKEQVLKYIPVMARPMVMFREKHPIHWTGVYADIEVSTNAPDMKPRWMIKLDDPMRRSEILNLTCAEPPCEKQKAGSRFTGYRLMTSVSIPVFDKKNHTTIENLGMKASSSPELKHLKKVRKKSLCYPKNELSLSLILLTNNSQTNVVYKYTLLKTGQ